MSGRTRIKFLMTNITVPNNFCFMKYALKSVPGPADVGVLHGDGDGPRTPPRCLEGVRKKFQMTNLSIPNNFSFIKYSLKAVLGVADVGDPHGGKDGPRTPAPGSRSKIHAYHVDQHEKLKGFDVRYLA